MKCLSLFSGIGGFDLALQNLGHEIIGNTMQELEDHYYGDNPYAKYCKEIRRIQFEMERSPTLKERFFGKKTDTKNHALNELLNYKLNLNKKLTSPITEQSRSNQE